MTQRAIWFAIRRRYGECDTVGRCGFNRLIQSGFYRPVGDYCSPSCRVRLPTSQAATVCTTDLRWPPWAETTSPAACSSSIPFCRILSATLMSRSGRQYLLVVVELFSHKIGLVNAAPDDKIYYPECASDGCVA